MKGDILSTGKIGDKYYRLKVNYTRILITDKGEKHKYKNLWNLIGAFENFLEDNSYEGTKLKNSKNIQWEMDFDTPYQFESIEEIESIIDIIEKDLLSENYDSNFIEIESFEIEEVNIASIKTIKKREELNK